MSRLWWAGPVLALLGCAHAGATAKPEGPGETVDDALHGISFELPQVEGGWQTNSEGTHLAQDVRVEVGSFPLGKPGTVASCRDAARARLSAMQKAAADEDVREGEESKVTSAPASASPPASKPEPRELPRDQATRDDPAPSWSFTRGDNPAAVRSRWAFFIRGADCLLIEVTGPLEKPDAAERAFERAARTARLQPLSPGQQREVDVMAAMGFLHQRDPAAALERFDALAAREPDFALAHYGALMAAFELGPTAYARGLPHGLAALASERELSGDQRQLALSALGVMQLAQNQVKQAAQTLAELVVRAPELAEGQYNYACALARLGDANGALDHLKTAFQIDASLMAHAREDEDLASLRGRADFEQVLRAKAATAAPSVTP